MLKIREEQMDAFRLAARARLRDRICKLLRQHLPEDAAKLDEADLAAFVEAGIERGRAWGFTWDSTLGEYVALSLLLGVDFDSQPYVRRVFADREIPIEQRVEALGKRVPPEEWKASTPSTAEDK